MAKEDKFITVSPSAVDETIELWKNWGWELNGAPQEVFNKDTHLESSGDSIRSVTETTHYVKVAFQRDKSMPHYDELCALENEFYSFQDPSFSQAEPKKFGFLGGGLIIFFFSFAVISLIFGLSFLSQPFGWFMTGQFVMYSLIFAIPGLIIFFRKKKIYEKKHSEWALAHLNWLTECGKMKTKRMETILKARTLL